MTHELLNLLLDCLTILNSIEQGTFKLHKKKIPGVVKRLKILINKGEKKYEHNETKRHK